MMFGELSGEFSAEFRAESEELGRRRIAQSRAMGLTDRSYDGDENGKHDTQSLISERIVSGVFGLPEPRSGTFKNERDVGPFEVREVTRDNGDGRSASLIIRPKDLAEPEIYNAPFILVVLRDNTYNIPGWSFGFEGPNLGREYARNGPPCWFVPISALYEFDQDFWDALETWKRDNLTSI
jgi:hypothetical protein